MSKKSFIDSVEVTSPCTEDWGKMHGNDRVRFCDHCAKDVKNLSAVTRKEAMRLVRASDGNLCIRYIPDPKTKRPMFADQLLQITRRTPGIAAGVMTASVSLSTLAYAQSEPIELPTSEPVAACPDKNVDEANKDEEKVEKHAAAGKIRGTVTDPNGAVIPFASVTLASIDGTSGAGVTADGDGVYEFDQLAPGTYRVEATARGFAGGSTEITISDENESAANIQLSMMAILETVEVRAVDGPRRFDMAGGMSIVPYRTPLATAISGDDVELVRELIGKGENVNAKDENYDQITPIFVAVEHANVEIVQLLLDAGAKVNARDGERQTPLMRLDEDATPELVEQLLRHGAKINLTDNESNTALILTTERVTPEVLKALIDAGADVNVVNKEGQTALMNAANADSLEKVRMLLEAGARVNLKNSEGETAWDMASDEEIQELLVSYGAEAKVKPVETDAAPQEVQVQDD